MDDWDIVQQIAEEAANEAKVEKKDNPEQQDNKEEDKPKGDLEDPRAAAGTAEDPTSRVRVQRTREAATRANGRQHRGTEAEERWRRKRRQGRQGANGWL